MLGDNGGDHHHEGAGGTADLGLGATQGRDQEAGDDGGVDTGLGRDPGRDAEGHGQRQGDQADGDAAGHVGRQVGALVVFKTFDRFREPLGQQGWFQADLLSWENVSGGKSGAN